MKRFKERLARVLGVLFAALITIMVTIIPITIIVICINIIVKTFGG